MVTFDLETLTGAIRGAGQTPNVDRSLTDDLSMLSKNNGGTQDALGAY